MCREGFTALGRRWPTGCRQTRRHSIGTVWEGETKMTGVTRVELLQGGSMVDTVIDAKDRTGGIDVSISLQDDGRTLKVFVKRREGA